MAKKTTKKATKVVVKEEKKVEVKPTSVVDMKAIGEIVESIMHKHYQNHQVVGFKAIKNHLSKMLN